MCVCVIYMYKMLDCRFYLSAVVLNHAGLSSAKQLLIRWNYDRNDLKDELLTEQWLHGSVSDCTVEWN